ncbi:hypothetical protein SSOG_06073 [Streptomyces himastatinicus ATCC 53653]|uniref:Uncharacterized protein n=1 Tax=Streptomyces himastatinicus ATCC 53653 TaxID=457427 RepID=D9WUH7_9ACTN|nr:hypothetical protein SSOG_06073 [Streptomyces himastatinicus ATCC 53653]
MTAAHDPLVVGDGALTGPRADGEIADTGPAVPHPVAVPHLGDDAGGASQARSEGKVVARRQLEKWLPGVVCGTGYRPEHITVRHLLNHTSCRSCSTRSRSTGARGTGARPDHEPEWRLGEQKLEDAVVEAEFCQG